MVCAYCRRIADKLTRDHILPKSAGFSLEGGNVAMVCADCNVSKANKPLAQWVAEEERRGRRQLRRHVLKFVRTAPTLQRALRLFLFHSLLGA
jgi:5-methylcytosine-specific restriction endonuclease McrA